MLVLRPVGFPSCQSRAAFSSLLFLGAGRNLSSLQHKICTTPTSRLFCWCWWMWGWSFSFLLHEAGPGHLQKVKVSKEGSPNGTCLPGHPVPFYKPENLQLSLSAPLLYLHWLLGLDFTGCQKLIPKTSLTEDTARTACCLLPLLSSLPFAAGTK